MRPVAENNGHARTQINWGDAINCALGVERDPLPVGHHDMAYRALVRSFSLASEVGVRPGLPEVRINGKKSAWPHYGDGSPRSLLHEICQALRDTSARCQQSIGPY